MKHYDIEKQEEIEVTEMTYDGVEVESWIHDGIEVFSGKRTITINISDYVTYIKWEVTEKDGTTWSDYINISNYYEPSQHQIRVKKGSTIKWTANKHENEYRYSYSFTSLPTTTTVEKDEEVNFSVSYSYLYRVKVKDWDGTVIHDLGCEPGSYLIVGSLTKPQRTGYQFSHWYSSVDGVLSGTYTSPIYEDATIEAAYIVRVNILVNPRGNIGTTTYFDYSVWRSDTNVNTSYNTSWRHTSDHVTYSLTFDLPYGSNITVRNITCNNEQDATYESIYVPNSNASYIV